MENLYQMNLNKKIQEIIEELNFCPNLLAESLKSSKSGLIGLLLAYIGYPFSSVLIQM